ncbi:MAG: hypothetical protein J1F03_06075 [Oscillospiraceae bacterium]|nr:hypothetical protein [Oscillospiraceae bacterium]
MARFEFDLEMAEQALDDVANLLSVFWGFFNEERPLFEDPDAFKARWFVQGCKTYESVLTAAWDKVRDVRADMEAAIDSHYKEAKSKAVIPAESGVDV